MAKEEPASLTDRLAQASVDARNVLREMQIATSDMRKLLKECDTVKHTLVRFVEDMGNEFKDKAAQALHEAGPSINKGVEDSIEKYTKALQKSTDAILTEVSNKIEQQRKHLDDEVKSVMTDLERTMTVSKGARKLSEECSELVRASHDKTQELVDSMNRLAEHFESRDNTYYLRIDKDEQGITRIETINEADIPKITHMGDKPEAADGE